MAYCETAEVREMIKDDALNALIGDEYIQNSQERELKITPIKITGSMSVKRIHELLGLSPLADAVMDSLDNGASTIYCIPISSSVDGTVSAVVKTVTADAAGTVTVAGKPNNAYSFVIKVTVSGSLNTAAIIYSIDGGLKFSEEITLPLGGSLPVSPTGITLTFVPGQGENNFIAGDTYSFTTTAPSADNASIIAAVMKLKTIEPTIEFVHIVGSSSKEQWAACAAIAEDFSTLYHRPLFFVFEAQTPAKDTAVNAYVNELKVDRLGCDSKYILVVSARGIYTRMDGTVQDINMAGIICGLFARAKVHQSIGETRSFSIPQNKLLSLTPIGIEEYLEELDTTGYLSIRRYEGLSGYYVTNARMFAPEGSDYQYAERIRVTNKIVREVRKELLLQLQSPIDISRQDAELQAIAKFAEIPLDAMKDAKEISSARIVIPEGQNILATETLHLIIKYVPVGYVREITVDLGMENPLI